MYRLLLSQYKKARKGPYKEEFTIQDWILQMVEQFGYVGVALLICIENVFPPIPSEVILTFAGFMTTYTSLNVWLVILAATIGAVAGAFVLYGAGRLLSPERLEKLLSGRVGKLLRLKPQDVHRAQNWFLSKGKFTVFFCRFIPVVRSLISIPAGMAKMHLVPFTLYTTVGTFLWNTVLVWLGDAAGASWERIAGYFDTYSKIAIVALGVLFVAAVAVFWFYRKKQADKKSASQLSKAKQLEENKD